MAQEERDRDRLELILDLIGQIERRARAIHPEQFFADRDERDLAAFRLAHIGEAASKLSAELKDRHTGLPWTAMLGMRNLISHDYVGIRPERVWRTITNDLPKLASVCRSELAKVKE